MTGLIKFINYWNLIRSPFKKIQTHKCEFERAGESFVWSVWQSPDDEEDKITTRAISCLMWIPCIQFTYMYHSIIRNAAAWYDKKKVQHIGCCFPILVTETQNLAAHGIKKDRLLIEDNWIHQLPRWRMCEGNCQIPISQDGGRLAR